MVFFHIGRRLRGLQILYRSYQYNICYDINLDETIKVAEISNSPVIVSGGVSSIKDIENIKSLNNKNIEGVIVGKAIYDGDINLKELSGFLYA